jgi:hypothetical protein
MRYAIAKFLIRCARRICASAWDDAVDARASKASVVVMMSALDMLSIGHCQSCPQTRGLTVFAGRAYCNRHQPVPELDAWSVK